MKIGFLITARLKSTRLPLKILKDLNGKTVIERIIDRTKEAKNISEIVLCTSTNPQDRPLIDTAKRNGIFYFRGEEEDVLRRLLSAAKFFDLDYFLNITADNPLFSIEYANSITEVFKKHKSDFVRIYGLPLGGAVYGVKTKALEVVCEVKNIADTEIWGYFFDRPDIFKVVHLEVDGRLKRPDLRLTLDYEEDYEVIRNVYSKLRFNRVLKLSRVIDYLDKNQEIAQINQRCKQKTLDLETKAQINNLFSIKAFMICSFGRYTGNNAFILSVYLSLIIDLKRLGPL